MYRVGYNNIRTVFTIHNIEYQGQFAPEIIEDLFGISKNEYMSLDWHGCINLMKGAIDYSDFVSTVSPTYAKEICSPQYAHGLEDILNKNSYKLRGILNGIDYDVYNPATNKSLFVNYDADHLDKKAENKTQLQQMLGLNVSPMIVDNEKKPGITMENYSALIGHVLEHTDLSVALIPHVVWASGDDRKPIRQLYEQFRDSGRVLCIPDACAPRLKGYISRCRMFIGARTHATIAAYSSCVPTLVVGYSVKARGIAKDLFGSWENYVLPVQTLEKKEDLTEAFLWLQKQEEAIRSRLTAEMPGYRERAREAGKLIRRLAE